MKISQNMIMITMISFFLGGGGENPLKHLSHHCLTAYFQLMLAYNKLNMIALLFYYTDTPHVCSALHKSS